MAIDHRQKIRNYYTYTLAYPASMGGKVFYVGKGTEDRINEHEIEAKRGGISEKCYIIRMILDCGEKVVKSKAYETTVERDTLAYEWILINLVYGYENLSNINEGGERGRPAGDQKAISIVLSKEIALACIASCGNISACVRRNVSLGLSDVGVIHSLSKNPRVQSAGDISPRKAYPVRLPLDLVDRMQMLPIGLRSATVEYLLRLDSAIQAHLKPSSETMTNQFTPELISTLERVTDNPNTFIEEWMWQHPQLRNHQRAQRFWLFLLKGAPLF